MLPPLGSGSGIRKETKRALEYPNIPSAIHTVPHSQELPFPYPPESYALESKEDEDEVENPQPSTSHDPDFVSEPEPLDPYLITQYEFNDLVRYLDLSKIKADLLASRLKQWNLLDKNVKVSTFRKREKKLRYSSNRKGIL